ncbi:type II toxin-antitoxin system RelE family toxin [Propionibacterium australiense]|uniref:RelE_StbE: addiction module toxin, RelE/StbE family n=1 Tax=Propionibacterium australiense TaxID=119981 RepID=A0A383S4P4_9ACTN|nr:type II toxin-antitoxin system RelE/ParE family toxin [Propionibacterium australiense]RLP10047.1 type II toxin-antitoxin system mRNA interferase toxin, RelE/StbE family [Propionibacterium australiense]RLP11331.1 type II toxin-antitoxin system mRNA interferase toxin, RelE/StbE family [Propionibacterium australiense]SYZ32965.1 RelE_StbE: addiction module toxin, RelE/StbE family [Propionibacterium australiense]VEH92339.1 addiction module toxin, RelE/StbE family [Propionibacterium australiense]
MTQWQLEYDPHVVRWLRKADRQTARRIRDALTAIIRTGNPRIRGKALTGRLAGLWRYRVGDYRLICDIRDTELIVLVLDVGARDHIYDR